MKQSKDSKKQLFAKLKTLLLVCVVYYLATWFTGCPIRYFLGVSCPGCGMTRAWIALLRLDFSGAFHFHPLFWTAPFIAAVFLFEDQIDFKKYRWLIVLAAALFFLVYIVRLIWFPSEIVSWNPSEGALYRTFRNLFFFLPGI